MNPLAFLFLSIFLIIKVSITWCLLTLIKIFVYLGEFSVMIPRNIFRFVILHLKALAHAVKFVFQAISNFIYSTLKSVLSFIRNSSSSIKRSFNSVISSYSSVIRKFGVKSTHLSTDATLTTKSFSRKVSHFLGMCIAPIIHAKRYFPIIKFKITKPHSPLPIHLFPKSKKKRFGILIVVLLLIPLFYGMYTGYQFYRALPSPSDIGRVNFALTSHVYDRNGKNLFDFYKDQNRTPIKLSELPDYVYHATVAIEDKDFYRHNGIAPISGIARAIRDWTIRKQGVQGGSTITQQLVKTALLTSERTIIRKIKEVIIALQAEQMYSKDKILEMYLNQVPYGGAVYGIEEASNKYFKKHAKDLSLSESALLAGLPQAPSGYSPFTNMKGAILRRNDVLKAMLEQGYITRAEYVIASRDKLNFSKDIVTIRAPHFVFYVKKYLESYLEHGDLDIRGYKISTTLDLVVQEKVEQILKEEIDKLKYLNVTNGAVLVTKPATGEIIAMVGSNDFYNGTSGEFNVTTGLRQPGSSIKPILYALAIDTGVTPASVLDDSPTVFRIGPTEVYRPVNYDGRFHGRVTIRGALANSYNIPAVKLMDRVGVLNFLSFAKKAGIDTWQDPSNYGLSLSLGGGEVTMIDMAEGYSMLANYGRKTDLNPILNLITNEGVVLKQADVESTEVVSKNTAYIISDILSDNYARLPAFGSGTALEVPGYKVAVKTGTTDEKRDNWTVGYTPEYLVTVWVGNNDHTPMNPYLTSGITGAAPIWNRVMTYLLSDYAQKQKIWYQRPDTIIEKQCLGRQEVFVKGTENSVTCVLPTPTPKKDEEHKN